ncbi:spore coat U domain-containing protein [Chitinibacter sp. SCUT-21]|uniref:spore coat protein U domain-containing protein n=1 Tax=Chitinibacter sp. SCUT-21 TaxID=2970891 RepID=UPI0035A62D54
MKKSAISLISSLLILGTITPAMAASKNVIINANVVGTCAFVSDVDVTINLGDLKAGSGDKTQQGDAQFWCSNGVPYTLSANDGQNAAGSQKNMKSGSDLLPYDLALSKTSGTGAGISSPDSVKLTATVLESAINVAPVQAGYTDTVVLTLTP